MPETKALDWPKIILSALASFILLSAAFSVSYWYGVRQVTQQISIPEPTPSQTRPMGGQRMENAIAFVKEGDVWMINSDGSDETRLTTDANAGEIKWSPNGNFIGWIEQKEFYYSNENTDWVEEVGVSLHVMNLQSGEIEEVVSQTSSDSQLRTNLLLLSLHDFDFSNDSSRIVYVRDGVWMKNLNTGTEQRIADNDLGDPDDPVDDKIYKRVDWSPTSDVVLLYKSFWDCGTGEIYYVASGQLEPVDLAVCNYGSWAPDGKSVISYNSSPKGETGLWVTSLDNRRKDKVVDRNNTVSHLVWSASASDEGQLIAIIELFPFEGTPPEKAQAIYRVDTNGAIEQLAPVDKRSSFLQWSPDSTKITYLSWVRSEPLSQSSIYALRILNADGSEEKVLATDISSYSWSPQ